MNLKIKDILKCTKGNLLIGNKEEECENFSKDTRTIKKGDTYIAIRGENFDGNVFWKDALDKGAQTVIMNKMNIDKYILNAYKNKNIIQVEDTKKALIQIAIAKREMYKDLIVIGITGSVGKTSTKDIIANVLSQKYNTLKTEGNNNNDIGLPLTILRLKDEKYAVIEMGMNHLGEISILTKIARPTISVITNIGTSHIGNLGSRDNILKAKLEILDGMEKPNIVVNNDNDLLHNWYLNNKNKINIKTFGIYEKSDCMAFDIVKEENSSSFICNLNDEKFEEKIPIGGEAFIQNSLCASIVGKMCRLSNNEIQKGISNFKLTTKRMENIILKNGARIINDSYNASFESMKASIEYLSNTKAKRKIAVLGDMFELGKYSEELHRKVGNIISENNINKLYLIGDMAKFIGYEAEKNSNLKGNIYYLESKEELLKKIKKEINKDDIVLFKAANAMRLFEIVEKLR